MKKIPTLFKRVFSPDHKTKTILPEVTSGCEAVLEGRCIPTVKWDGACCAIINGEIYKRYDAKIGKNGKQKKPPEGAIPCQPEPDPVTGHWPHWVKCVDGNPADKYFLEAFGNYSRRQYAPNGTYEAIGVSWQSNPYNLKENYLVRHGWDEIKWADICVSDRGARGLYDALRRYLICHLIEGIVFWCDGEPLCKIKRSDFGFEWPIKEK